MQKDLVKLKHQILQHQLILKFLNPDLVICNLDENTNFHMEMTVRNGKGYVSADMNKPEEPPLGLNSN